MGPRRLSVAFLNDYYKPDAPDPNQRDRNLIIESIEIEGPLYSTGDPLPESHRRIVFTTPKNNSDVPRAAHAILERFASRAFRRPVSEDELAKLTKLVELAIQNGDPFERGIQLADPGCADLATVSFPGRAWLAGSFDEARQRVKRHRFELIGDLSWPAGSLTSCGAVRLTMNFGEQP